MLTGSLTRARRLATVRTAYNELTVLECDGIVELDVGGASHSLYDPHHFLTGYSWDALTAATVLLHRGRPRSLLLLGLGGGTVARQVRHLFPAAAITAVEIDAEMVRLARTYMQLDALELDVVIADAYAHLAAADRRYDVILDDVYTATGLDVARPHLIAGEKLEQLVAHLEPDGLLAVNLVTGAGHRTLQMHTRRAFLAAFPEACRVVPPLGANEILAGSARLRAPDSLRRVSEQFTTSHDTRLWRRIAVRRIP